MKSESGEKESDLLEKIIILYEDGDVVVAYKPVGLVVHNDGRTEEGTVVDWFLVHVPEAKDVGEPGFAQDGTFLNRSGVVHRLDRDTSGVLILAKHQDSFLHLKAQFHDHLVRKEYRAFVYGTMKEKWGTINKPIGRSAKDFRLRTAEKGARGILRSAVTDWELLEQSSTHAYLALFPKTGRTHQIRVHLRALSRPIVCDEQYALPILLSGENLGFERLALHAHRLTITLPSGKTDTFEAPLPPDFVAARSALATTEAVC